MHLCTCKTDTVRALRDAQRSMQPADNPTYDQTSVAPQLAYVVSSITTRRRVTSTVSWAHPLARSQVADSGTLHAFIVIGMTYRGSARQSRLRLKGYVCELCYARTSRPPETSLCQSSEVARVLRNTIHILSRSWWVGREVC